MGRRGDHEVALLGKKAGHLTDGRGQPWLVALSEAGGRAPADSWLWS